MPFELMQNKIDLVMEDSYTKEKIKMVVILPNSAQRIKYQSDYADALVKKNTTVQQRMDALQETKNDYASQAIVSIEPGYFIKNGEVLDTSEKNKAEWFGLLVQERSDLIDTIIEYLFGQNSKVVKEGNLNFL